MSFGLPATIEPQVIRYAQEEHITPIEAVERLIQAGLHAQASAKTSGEDMIGAFSGSEDRAVMAETTQQLRAARRGPLGPIRTDDDLSIMGVFADVDGFQETIDAVISNRAQR